MKVNDSYGISKEELLQRLSQAMGRPAQAQAAVPEENLGYSTPAEQPQIDAPEADPEAMTPGPQMQLSPQDEMLKRQLQKQYMENIGEQKKDIASQKEALGAAAQLPSGVDYTPLHRTLDEMYHVKPTSEYSKPAFSPQDQIKLVEGLRSEISKGQKGLGDEQVKMLQSMLGGGQAKQQFQNAKLTQAADRQDRNEHMKIVGSLNQNKALADRASQYQNLMNSMALITNVKTVTPQQFKEFQQAVRGNLGIKGNSTGDERSGTFLDSMGLNRDNFTQFLSATPQDIGKNNKLLAHMKDMANAEMNNVRSQYADTMDSVSGGRASMYARRPDLKSDLEKKIHAMGKRVAPMVAAPPADGSKEAFMKQFIDNQRSKNGGP